MKNIQVLVIFIKNLHTFEIFWKCCQLFLEDLGKIRKYAFLVFSGAKSQKVWWNVIENLLISIAKLFSIFFSGADLLIELSEELLGISMEIFSVPFFKIWSLFCLFCASSFSRCYNLDFSQYWWYWWMIKSLAISASASFKAPFYTGLFWKRYLLKSSRT